MAQLQGGETAKVEKLLDSIDLNEQPNLQNAFSKKAKQEVGFTDKDPLSLGMASLGQGEFQNVINSGNFATNVQPSASSSFLEELQKEKQSKEAGQLI